MNTGIIHGWETIANFPGGGKTMYRRKHTLIKTMILILSFVLVFQMIRVPGPVQAAADQWAVTRVGDDLQIAYGSDGHFPQYGVLHLYSGYFRLLYAEDAGWGTSVILMPTFWSGGVNYQGTNVNASHRIVGENLELTVTGITQSLSITTTVLIEPPVNGVIQAQVSANLTGTINLDNRPGEAFKPVFLSSMRISDSEWDTSGAFAGCQTYSVPWTEGWVISAASQRFTNQIGLFGGTSSWKTNAPAVWILMDEPLQAAGWVTGSADPNDDNVGYWLASDTVLTDWSYRIIISDQSAIQCVNLPLLIK